MTRQTQLGARAPTVFTHGSGQVDSDVVVEWDADNDDDFDETVEDITTYVRSAQTFQGRDWPSQLTGRSAPGTLTLEVENTDNRFDVFNAASPLNTPPFSLDFGRKIRVRTSTATDTYPSLLAQDRFLGDGDLGETENGLVWTQDVSSFTPQILYRREGGNAVAGSGTSTAGEALAVVDIGQSDAFIQIRISHADYINGVGLVYRYADIDNYGFLYIQDGQIFDNVLISGAVSNVTPALKIEPKRENFMFGIHVGANGVTAEVDWYLDGTKINSSNSANTRDTSDTNFGIYSFHSGQRPPAINEFYAWSGRPQRDDGIIWTGAVANIIPFIAADDAKMATIECEGELSKTALADIVEIPTSLGADVIATYPGSTTGQMIGNVLGGFELLHPGGEIDVGEANLGPVAVDRDKAINFIRRMEEVEFGFLKESNEGRIEFESAAHRDAIPVGAGFSDLPGSQFVYSDVELLDWRRELINRVSSQQAAKRPEIRNIFGGELSNASGVQTDVAIAMPNNTTNGGVVGDLVLVHIASTVQTDGRRWENPATMVNLRDSGDLLGRERWYAHILSDATFGESFTFYDDVTPFSGGAFAWYMYHIVAGTWFGEIESGVSISDPFGFGPPNTQAFARLGTNNPSPVLPSWGRTAPSLFITTRTGYVASTASAVVDAAFGDSKSPFRYSNRLANLVEGNGSNNFDVAIESARRFGIADVEDPSPFSQRFENFDWLDGSTVAVRGFQGSPPSTSGGQVVESDDRTSQERHRIIVNHTNPAEFFADEAAAASYNTKVLNKYGLPRPILRMSFVASRSSAYRAQAFRNRVSDKIFVTANNGTGMGIADVFAIESISHRWGEGMRLWTTTYELSQSSPGG